MERGGLWGFIRFPLPKKSFNPRTLGGMAGGVLFAGSKRKGVTHRGAQELLNNGEAQSRQRRRWRLRARLIPRCRRVEPLGRVSGD